MPAADRDQFRAWSATIVSETVSPEVAQAHVTAMIAYFRDLFAVRRRPPADDLLSALISARDEGDSLSEDELLSMAWLLLVAGHETTVNLIAGGVLALLLNPGELARLRADPTMLGSAVEEMLRYVSPVNDATLRFAGGAGGARRHPHRPGRGGAGLAERGEPGSVPLRRPERLDVGRDAGGHWRSVTVSITAWAPRWPGSRPRSRSAGCWSGSAG